MLVPNETVIHLTKAQFSNAVGTSNYNLCMTDKMTSMPGNVILMMGNMEKIQAEAMFCAYEKSHCIKEEKGCICATCEIFKEYNLGKQYFCTTTNGK
jgi:hypothetical protein